MQQMESSPTLVLRVLAEIPPTAAIPAENVDIAGVSEDSARAAARRHF
jgi:hypothetical protein